MRESLAERETLLATAPHLVRPLPLLVPVYEKARRGALTIRAGMWLYDLLSADKSLPTHRMLDAAGAREACPGIAAEGLAAAALYYDGQLTFPERLVIENLLDARNAGAELHAYTRAERVLVEAGRVIGVIARDLRTDETATLRAPLVVNATGPWVDQLLGTLAGRRPRRLIGGSRGAHLVVDALPGLADTACYSEAASDGRPFFILPWNGMTLIGTTDIASTGDPDESIATEAEIDYLIAEARRLFPDSGISREHVRYVYSGVRPLPFVTAREQASITRRHLIRHHRTVARGLYSVIGGKLTTYRSLAEEVVNRLARKLRRDTQDCETATRPLPGASKDSGFGTKSLLGAGTVSSQTAARLAALYGTRAGIVVALAKDNRDLATVVCEHSGAIAAEFIHAFESDLATSFADALMRRTMLGLNADLGAAALEPALAITARHRGWDAARVAEERRVVERERAALRVPSHAH